MIKNNNIYRFVRLKQNLWIVFAIVLILTMASCTRIEPVSPQVETGEPGIWHTIQPGENLEQISRKYRVSKLELQQLNDIYDPRDINPGMEIFIPRVKPAPPKRLEDRRLAARKANKLVWPAKGTISSGYGIRHGRMHQGVDITKDGGREIRAAEAGKVIFAGTKKGYGRTIVIDHGHGLKTLYAHNAKLYVRKNNRVKQGAIISKMGSSGRSKGIHLHFEVRLRNKPQNPLRYLAVR